MEHKIDQALVEYLSSQRWFAAKGRMIQSAEIVEHAIVPAQSERVFRLAIAEITYLGHTPERYLLALSEDEAGRLREAINDDAFAIALLDLVRLRGELAIGSTVIRGETFANSGAHLQELSERPRIRRLGVEQSNTSIVFDEKVILKLVRKIEPGINPEYEIGVFMSQRHFDPVPPLVGALQLEGAAGTTLAVLHRFVANAVDGWEHTLRTLGANKTPPNEYLEQVRLLGTRVAQLHKTLADSNEPAFAPEPLLAQDFQAWSASIIGELGVSLAMASSVRPELEAIHESLRHKLRALAKEEPSGMKSRIHGDLHLGQVLFSQGDWKIFDFEGEPARTFYQRREKYSCLKDVAGMLRSFAYADAASRLRAGGIADAEHRRIVPLRASFLEGYRTEMADSPLLPRGKSFDVLLEALELEKLLYELRYEIQNRPDWVRIPADDLTALENEAR